MRTSHRTLSIVLFVCMVLSCGKDPTESPSHEKEHETESDEYIVASPIEWDGQKRSDITYQLLVYSFADTDLDTDNIGDIKGITEHLDYIESLGATAVLLSPIHPCMSYHGYGVSDYYAVRPEFGTEDDLKSFIEAAHQRGVKVYLDYVLNHCGTDNSWFIDAKSGETSPYRQWFAFSSDPQSDIVAGRIAQIATQGANGYNPDEWRALEGNTGYEGVLKFHLDFSNPSKPTVTVTEASEAEIDPSNDIKSADDKYIHYDSKSGRKRLYNKGNGVYELTFRFKSNWGFLITSEESGWPDKYGSQSRSNCIEFGIPFNLVERSATFDPADITFTIPVMWHALFKTDKYADFNFGDADHADESPAFKELLNSAEHWIALGVDGMRIDAAKHIYRNETSAENPTFLKKWYDATNQLYHKYRRGIGQDFYTVGEVLTSKVQNVAPYYSGLPALFEFAFWTRLRDDINSANGSGFVDDILSFRDQYRTYRSDFIEPTKLSNHDEKRTGSELGRSTQKMRLAACVLLTAGGSPYIYQGEELGYWGTQDKGDEYVRTPIIWDMNGAKIASGLLGGKIDSSMLQAQMSVEAQSADETSLLNLYRTFARLRNTYPALALGSMERHPLYNASARGYKQICAYYRVYEQQRILVVHNFSSASVSIKLDDTLDTPIGLSGKAKVRKSGTKSTLTIEPYASVVFDVG